MRRMSTLRNWNAIISNQEDVTEAINVTLAEFEDRYYLHDSSIDKIDFDADKKNSHVDD